jgi:hypothetical protein
VSVLLNEIVLVAPSTASMKSISRSSTKHLFKFLKNVAKTTPKALRSSSLATLCEALKALEWILSSKGVLRLLIACHAGLVVDPALAFVGQCFVSIVDT